MVQAKTANKAKHSAAFPLRLRLHYKAARVGGVKWPQGRKVLNLEINKIFALTIGVVAFYSGYIILPGLPEAYTGWQSFFDQSNSVYPILITGLYSAVPFGFLSVAALVYLNKRSYFIFPLLLVGWFVFISNTVYLVLILVLFWWFKQSLIHHLTRRSSKDAA